MTGETIRLPADDVRGRAARAWSTGSTPTPRCTASSCRCRCRSTSTPTRCFSRIDPAKDVDGFHPVNVGKLLIGDTTAFVPCTPAGVQQLLDALRRRDQGRGCVVVGRSNIVGKPMAACCIQSGPAATRP